MRTYFQAVMVASVLGAMTACKSVTPTAPPAPAVRTSQDIANRIETVANEDFSPGQADVAVALRIFAGAYQAAHNYSVAEALYQRALAIQEAMTPPDNQAMAQTL